MLISQTKCSLSSQVKKIRGAHRFAREPAACGHDCGDAASCRLHPSHPDPQQMLAAVARLPREVRRLDPPALEKLLQSRRHVQYLALYARAISVSRMNDGFRVRSNLHT